VLVATRLAPNPSEAVRQDATAEVVAELALDKARQPKAVRAPCARARDLTAASVIGATVVVMAG
jgi:predicted flap endonuclease-1-like 5' DNA nuclease